MTVVACALIKSYFLRDLSGTDPPRRAPWRPANSPIRGSGLRSEFTVTGCIVIGALRSQKCVEFQPALRRSEGGLLLATINVSGEICQLARFPDKSAAPSCSYHPSSDE